MKAQVIDMFDWKRDNHYETISWFDVNHIIETPASERKAKLEEMRRNNNEAMIKRFGKRRKKTEAK